MQSEPSCASTAHLRVPEADELSGAVRYQSILAHVRDIRVSIAACSNVDSFGPLAFWMRPPSHQKSWGDRAAPCAASDCSATGVVPHTSIRDNGLLLCSRWHTRQPALRGSVDLEQVPRSSAPAAKRSLSRLAICKRRSARLRAQELAARHADGRTRQSRCDRGGAMDHPYDVWQGCTHTQQHKAAELSTQVYERCRQVPRMECLSLGNAGR